jgi:hypothetical protein
MKKIIALVLALSLLATMVFAEPVALASGLIQTTDLISEADPDNSLFADVEAPQLAALEADAVEGDGPILGAAVSYALSRYNVPQRIEASVYNAQMAVGGFSPARAQANAVSLAGVLCVAAVVIATKLPTP